MLKVLDDLVEAGNKLTYLEVSGPKKSPMQLSLLVFWHLWREEMGHQTLGDYFIVSCSFFAVFTRFLFEDPRVLSQGEVIGPFIPLVTHIEVFSLNFFFNCTINFNSALD